jgi:hypothetical protein
MGLIAPTLSAATGEAAAPTVTAQVAIDPWWFSDVEPRCNAAKAA